MKLWDIRMALSTDRFQSLRLDRTPTFDYRLSRFRKRNWFRDPNENSLVTFRGHKVLQTLIRCHFSPPISSNSRYVYSGSQDGKVYIWNLDATLVKTIDVRGTTMTARHHDLYPLSSWMSGDIWQTCVRDASWHPHVPILVGM
jgi:WD repeat-containing protein 23